MRKINPDDVKQDFDDQLTALATFCTNGLAAFSSESDKSAFVTSCMLVLAVAWEGFINDLLIAYVNGDASRFKQHLESAFEAYLSEATKPKSIFTEFGTITFPTHLTKKQVQEFADDEGSNITFSSYDKLEDKASVWLVAATAQKFTQLTDQQKAVVNAAIALRNHIAHRSERSGKTMNEKIHAGALHPTGLRRGENSVSNIGAWLKAVPVGKHTSRFSMFVGEMRAIALAL